MRIPVVEVIAGTTLRATYVSSGIAVPVLSSALLSGSETLVNSVAAVSSGNGFFFALNPIPNSPHMPWLVNEWIGVIASNTYIDRQLVRVHRLEVE